MSFVPMREDRFYPDYDIKPPDLVQKLIDGTDEDEYACGNCRQPGLLRCGRCKCVKYCSAECQKIHFSFHKKNCKAISRQKANVEESLTRFDGFPMAGYEAVKEMMEYADLLVTVGYQESDTVENGKLFYREALKYYTEPMKVYRVQYHEALGCFLEDRVILLIVALGGGDEEIKAWCTSSEITGPHRVSGTELITTTKKSGRHDYYEVSGLPRIDHDDPIFQLFTVQHDESIGVT